MFSFFSTTEETPVSPVALLREKQAAANNGKNKKVDHRKYIALALSQNKRQQQPQDTTQNTEESSTSGPATKIDPLVDDIISSYMSRHNSNSGTNARVKVLIPAEPTQDAFVSARTFEEKEDDDDAASSCYESEYSSAGGEEEDDASFVSAAQSAAASIRSRLSIFRRKKKNKKKKKQKESTQNNTSYDDKSVGGDQSVRSQASSVFGLSVSSLSVRKLISRRRKNKKARNNNNNGIPLEVNGRPRSILKRTLHSAEHAPEFSVDGDEYLTGSAATGKKQQEQRRTVPGLLALHGSTRANVVSPTQSNTKSTDSQSDEDEEENFLAGQGAFPRGNPLRMDSSIKEALEKSGSVSHLNVSEFAPRLEDPEEPLLDALGQIVNRPSPEKAHPKVNVIDPLDMEFFLKDVGEANRDSSGFFEDDDVSSLSLSSCGSALSVSSTPLAQDDYGVYEKKVITSSSSYCADKATGKSARMTSILHGDLAAAAAAKNRPAKKAYEMPSSMQIRTTRTISLLLLDPVLKIFEIVQVVCSAKTTLEEVLDKAKAAAVDETLADQTYTGLCNDSREAVNPSALVLRLAPRQELKVFSTFTLSDKEMKQAMERHLLVAVPATSTAAECQKIRRMLWKNPKLQAYVQK